MILKLIVDDQLYELNVPEALLAQAEPFFQKMDKDMNDGWQMGREWTESPDKLQRCQIVANKLLTAIENEDDKLGRMMAGYILSRAPEIEAIEPDLAGEIQDTRFTLRQSSAPTMPAPTPGKKAEARGGLSKMEAMARAGKEVSKVFRVGKQWRFSVYNPSTEQWEDSPLAAQQSEAETLRDFAVKKRFEELCR